MKAEEKAQEIVRKMTIAITAYAPLDSQRAGDKQAVKELNEAAKQCALIACREILELKLIEDNSLEQTTKLYWKAVEKEILLI